MAAPPGGSPEPGQSVCVPGSREQTTNATALEGEPKQTISGGERVWLSWGSPMQHTGTKALVHAGAGGQRKGGEEAVRAGKQSKIKGNQRRGGENDGSGLRAE